MSLKTDLEKWDGKHIDDLNGVYNNHNYKPSFIPSLLKLLDNQESQREVTWLIKQYCKEEELKPELIKMIYKSLKKLNRWESRIQILQVIPFMPVAKPEKKLECMITLSNNFTQKVIIPNPRKKAINPSRR